MKRNFLRRLAGGVLLLLAIAGCRPASSAGLTDDLTLFYETDASGDTLTGVRRTADRSVLIAPMACSEVWAEEHFLVFRTGAYRLEVFFRNDGKRLGKFETFMRMKHDEANYYIGTNYRYTYCYFPQRNLLLKATDKEERLHDIRLKVDGEWQTRSYLGDPLPDGSE